MNGKYLAVFLNKDGSVLTSMYVSTRESFMFLPRMLPITRLRDVEKKSPSMETVTYRLAAMEGNAMIYRGEE